MNSTLQQRFCSKVANSFEKKNVLINNERMNNFQEGDYGTEWVRLLGLKRI